MLVGRFGSLESQGLFTDYTSRACPPTQLQFLFELPARLNKCIEMDAYRQAVKYVILALFRVGSIQRIMEIVE